MSPHHAHGESLADLRAELELLRAFGDDLEDDEMKREARKLAREIRRLEGEEARHA